MADGEVEEEYYENNSYGGGKKGNNLPTWGNVTTMNLNPLILTNITCSPYFKVSLAAVKTYHEVVDEIYYKVNHLEPWEKGSRSTSGQTGMCGGVRGVGAGGIVSSSFCLLYKLSTLKLTRKQVNGLLNHCDSPYIRGLGFMYIRFTQPPQDFLEWYEPYLEDEEEIDVKAGGGKIMTIGEMVKAFMLKLEWFDTRFPRIPVNVQKEINQYFDELGHKNAGASRGRERTPPRDERRDKHSSSRDDRSRDHRRDERPSASRDERRDRHGRSRDRDDKRRDRSRERKRSRSREDKRRHRSRSRDEKRRERSRSRERHHHHKRDHRDKNYEDELRNYSEHRKKSKKNKRSRSRSGSRHR